MYLKKGDRVCHTKTDGSGLYLRSESDKGFETVENGLYLMKQCGLYDGRGLILCPNSPFKIIPILGMNVRLLVRLLSEKKLYTLKMEIDEIHDNDRHIYRLKKIDEIQEILTVERDKRNELSTKYNRGVNIIGVIDNCLGVTAIGLDITGVGLLSTIVAAPALIGIEIV